MQTDTSERDIVVLSNTEPYEHVHGANGVTCSAKVSGLTEAIDDVMRTVDGTWVAWGDGPADFEVTDEDGRVRVPCDGDSYTLRRLKLSEDEKDKHYEGFCNRVLWPMCHGFPSKMYLKSEYWDFYERVNRRFADAVIEEASDESVVWTQDYHFALVPNMVREELDAELKHFWHIPWPGVETFRLCPRKEEVLRGLLGNDELEFHIDRYRDNFLDCVDQLLDDAVVDGTSVEYDGRITEVVSLPIGVDVADLRETTATQYEQDWEEFKQEYGITTDTVLLGVERVDYMKGIPRRLDALELLLEQHESLQGRITYVQKSSMSRSGIPEYQETNEVVEQRIADINERFGTEAWQPIVHIRERLPGRMLYMLYKYSDVMLVTSPIDGMNLVSQEYVAASEDGALVLSEFAGSAEILSDGAYMVNPYDTPDTANGIARALLDTSEEKQERMESMTRAVESNDIHDWFEEVGL